MAQGNGTRRELVMHNDFVIVGPPEDPAQLKGTTSALEAMKKLVAAGAPFVSRGDNSGTQQLELALWKQAGVDPKSNTAYIETGTGMGQTLTIADQKRAYTIADRATWLAWQRKIDLPILVQGDRALFNVYHVMPVNPDSQTTRARVSCGSCVCPRTIIASSLRKPCRATSVTCPMKNKMNVQRARKCRLRAPCRP